MPSTMAGLVDIEASFAAIGILHLVSLIYAQAKKDTPH